MRLLLFVGLLLLGKAWGDDASAKIILVKNIINKILTEGKEISIEYNLFNVGDGIASDVMLADTTFPDTTFQIIKGLTSVKWDRIHPGTNVTHIVVVCPIKSGPFNFTSSVVQYVASEGSDSTFGYSNEIGELEIISLKEFNRAHASHLFDWCFFALWCVPSLLFPYALFYVSKRRYTSRPKKNN